MIRSRNENRKPFAPNFLKIPTRQHRCNKVARRTTEVAIAVKALNRMNELGQAKFVQVT